METLTKREEEIMQVMWTVKRGLVHDIIERLEDPKPPYNTISSIVRILEKKGFVGHKAYGKTHEYFPTISKLNYKRYALKKLMKNYFEGSYENVVSFLINEKDVSDADLQEIKEIIDSKENKQAK